MRSFELLKFAAPLVLLAIPSDAQMPWGKHNFTVGGGAAIPRDDLAPFFETTGALRFGYGYRFHRYFQADAGLEVGFQAARIRDFFESQFGDLRIRDYQYFVPLGGRVVVPFADEKAQFYAGGGGAYLRYSEIIRQPFGDSGFRIDCPVCRSRSGWGYYGMVGANVALDRGRHFRLGGGLRVYRAKTEGDSFGTLPAVRTQDRWINPMLEFTFSF
jgi:hypothetical protein